MLSSTLEFPVLKARSRDTLYYLLLYIMSKSDKHRGLPLITYATRGGGGVNTNAYKCIQGGRGGLNMSKNTHFVRSFIENATISEPFKNRVRWFAARFGKL